MKSLKIYRRWLLVILAVVLCFTGYYAYNGIKKMIPDSIMIKSGDEFKYNLGICSVFVDAKAVMSDGGSGEKIPENQINIRNDISSYTFSNVGTFTAEYKLFGLINLKEVEINVIEDKKIIPAGCPVGIYVETNGVMVIGTGSVYGMDNAEYSPAENIVKSGDYIVSVNQENVKTKAELVDKINQFGSDELVLGIRRNNENIKVKIKPVQTSADEYKIGIWIRDNTQGVGMITYIRGDGSYGALGHGITDIDTGLLMEVNNGQLFNTEIISIVKGERGKPGELIGMIDYNEEQKIGQITDNTDFGIKGKLLKVPDYLSDKQAVEIASKEEIKKGKAIIQSCIDGQVRQYEIEIVDINKSDKGNKGIVLEVTDQELLNKTGGIVQGLSGSPILQNGKIIGAVTHVFVNDPAKGYGIFIENMLGNN